MLDQSRPQHLCEVIAAVEPDDALTLEHLRPWPQRLAQAGRACEIVCSDGGLRSKPRALHLDLPRARGEYFVFYDGADRLDRRQLRCGITSMLREHSDVAQARVLRDRPSLPSRFLLFDTVTWCRKYPPLLIPLYRMFVGGCALSSFFRGTSDWGKTERGRPLEPPAEAAAHAALVPDGTSNEGAPAVTPAQAGVQESRGVNGFPLARE